MSFIKASVSIWLNALDRNIARIKEDTNFPVPVKEMYYYSLQYCDAIRNYLRRS